MTLVETLVTLVSTSVGLLGVAALQLVSLRSNHDAYLRLQASTLATSMIERMRANERSFLAGEYDGVSFNASGVAETPSGADIEAWQKAIDERLPGGDDIAAGAIQRTPDSNVVTVIVRWGERSDRGGSAGSVSLQTQAEI